MTDRIETFLDSVVELVDNHNDEWLCSFDWSFNNKFKCYVIGTTNEDGETSTETYLLSTDQMNTIVDTYNNKVNNYNEYVDFIKVIVNLIYNNNR